MSECGDVSSAWLHTGSSDLAANQRLLKLNGTAIEPNGNVWNDSGLKFLCQERDISSAGSEVEQKLAEQKSDKKFFRKLETSDLITFSDTADTGSLFSLGTDNMMRTDDRLVCSSDEVSDHSCSFGDVVGVNLQSDMHSIDLKKSSSAADGSLSDYLPYQNEESITPSSTQDASSTAEIRKPTLPEYFTARKGSDIRNNIPDMRNVKSYDRTLDTLLHCLQPKSNLMKMKKSSPGLAKRLVNGAGQERTTECVADGDASAVELGLLHEESLENELDAGTGRSPITERISGNVQDSVAQRSSSELCLKDFETERSEGIELCSLQEVEQAFAECEDRGHSENGDGGRSESVTCSVFSYSYGLRDAAVGSFAEFSDEWSHVLTMSPGLSECSEVGSSVSEDIDLLSCGEMPFVDDGLSVCDDSSLPAAKHDTSTSASEVLQRGSNNRDEDPDIVANLNLSESDVAEFFSSSLTGDFVAAGEVDEEAVCQRRRETFDLAMRDINHAIQNSNKNVCNVDHKITDYFYQSAELDEEPVWVIRSKDMIQTKLQQEDKNSQFDEKAETTGAWPLNGDDSTDDEDEETDELLLKQHDDSRNANLSNHTESSSPNAEKNRVPVKKEGDAVLIEGLLFRTSYLGSTQLISDCNPTKIKRMKQAKEAVDCVKLPVGESQPRVEVDLFVSAEKIMVLDIVRQEVMMDYALQTISYIADMDDILILMVRQSLVVSSSVDGALASPAGQKKQVKICCHVFESDEAQLIAESISRAFQVAYGEFLRANGIDNPGLLSDINYQEVLNQQQIFGEELSRFSNKDMQQEVTISKLKGEPLGVVIVESGWGSLLPTAVVANLSLSGPAAKSNQINIGDQIMAVNGVSLVGLPLSTCQNYIRAVRPDTIVRLTLVSCSPVVEVVIKRPDIKYQLGFSVQNGVICSLLRGGIGERGGVRVGHRIIEVNGQSMVAVSHDKIIRALATCVGELHMKTMQMTIFRLLTGEHTPHFI